MRASFVSLMLVGTLLGGCRGAEPSSRLGPHSRSTSASVDEVLEREIASLADGFEGDVGIFVHDLATNRTASLHADELFPTASMIKVPILIGIFDKLERGELSWRKPLIYEARRKYPGEDVLARFQDGAEVSLSELVTFMCTFSDNTASLWCQELAGGGETINSWLAEHAFALTRVNSRTSGREEGKQLYGWGQTSPREMAALVEGIAQGSILSSAASAEMLRSLSRSYWTNEALSAIPPDVHSASKQGAVDASRSEVVWVDAPHGPYVFCVITKHQKDTSWQHDNAGFVLLRRVSQLLWRHFERAAPWRPGAGADRYF